MKVVDTGISFNLSPENPPGSKLTDQELGERFENLAGRKATSMQKSNVISLLISQTPDSFPVTPAAHCIKGRLHENRGDYFSVSFTLPSLPLNLHIISPQSFVAFEEQISRDWD